MDNLSSSQFDFFIDVLHSIVVERDFKALLTPASIQDVIENRTSSSKRFCLTRLIEARVDGDEPVDGEMGTGDDLSWRFPLIPSTKSNSNGSC